MNFAKWFGLGRHREVVPLEPIPLESPPEGAGHNRKREPLPQFQDSASDLARGGPDPIRIKLRSAFTPSQPVADLRMFAGRQDLLRTMIRALEDQHLHVVLYGDRGIGKTSMLHVLAQLAREARYIIRYTSCSESSNFSDTFRAVASDIPLLFHADIDPASEQAEQGGVLADLLPPGEVTVAQVSDLLTKIAGTRVLVVLDEFDRSDSSNLRRSIAELIKNLSDRSTRVQLVIAGVASNLSELIQHIPSIRRNIIALPVPNMSDDDVVELIQMGAAASGLGYDRPAISLITRIANGSPYLASLISQHAGIVALDRGAQEVGHDDVVVAAGQALHEVELRVDPHHLHSVTRVAEPELKQRLADLSGEALQNIGQIADNPDDADRSREIAMLAGEYDLLEPNPDMPVPGYRFREDGVVLYLWLSHMVESIQQNALAAQGTVLPVPRPARTAKSSATHDG